MSTDGDRCPACGAGLTAQARYCEACGHDLAGPVPASGSAASEQAFGTAAVGTSMPPESSCVACGHTDIGPDGFCESCGARQPAAARHSEVDLGAIAGISDIGSRHHNNEDAMGLAIVEHVSACVVCDGVSSSNRPDTAATAAAAAATKIFAAALPALDAADPPEPSLGAAHAGDGASAAKDPSDRDAGQLLDVRTHEVTRSRAAAIIIEAAAAAQAAAALVAGHDTGPNPPSTTFVAAILTASDVTIGWIGDSRAYWVPDPETPGDPTRLTVDDTLAGQLAAAGVAVGSDAPNAVALIRWLGADAMDTEPHIATFVPPGAGRVIVCSDGLYRYVPEPAELAAATPSGSPIEAASTLVRLALDAGGQDNVTVVVLPYPPELTARR